MLLIAGLVGLVEQEFVRVLLGVEPSLVISGICLVFVLVGAGVAVVRNVRIGPVEISVGSQSPEEETKEAESEGKTGGRSK